MNTYIINDELKISKMKAIEENDKMQFQNIEFSFSNLLRVKAIRQISRKGKQGNNSWNRIQKVGPRLAKYKVSGVEH